MWQNDFHCDTGALMHVVFIPNIWFLDCKDFLNLETLLWVLLFHGVLNHRKNSFKVFTIKYRAWFYIKPNEYNKSVYVTMFFICLITPLSLRPLLRKITWSLSAVNSFMFLNWPHVVLNPIQDILLLILAMKQSHLCPEQIVPMHLSKTKVNWSAS